MIRQSYLTSLMAILGYHNAMESCFAVHTVEVGAPEYADCRSCFLYESDTLQTLYAELLASNGTEVLVKVLLGGTDTPAGYIWVWFNSAGEEIQYVSSF